MPNMNGHTLFTLILFALICPEFRRSRRGWGLRGGQEREVKETDLIDQQ